MFAGRTDTRAKIGQIVLMQLVQVSSKELSSAFELGPFFLSWRTRCLGLQVTLEKHALIHTSSPPYILYRCFFDPPPLPLNLDSPPSLPSSTSPPWLSSMAPGLCPKSRRP